MGALPFFGAGCGSDIECGAGTVEVDGECVPTSDVCGDGATWDETTGRCVGAECAAGTTLVNGECVPDGSVICGDGTTYNTQTGECDPDITECAEGTTEVDGVCVPNDDLLPDMADVQEGAEPNGLGESDTPGSITLPEVGESVTIYGCVTPYEDADQNGNLDPDYDLYMFTVTGQSLLDVTIDGIAGLSGGFQIISADEQLYNDDWYRLGINLVGDAANRKVFLPKAGTYGLLISDGRSLFFGEGFGGADTCYFATITQQAVPTPTAFSSVASLMCQDGTTCTSEGSDECSSIGDGRCTNRVADALAVEDVHFYSYPADEGDLIWTTMAAPSDVMVGALVDSIGNAYAKSTNDSASPYDIWTMLPGLSAGDTVVIAVDHFYHIGLSDVDYFLDVADPGAVELPDDGTSATISHISDFYSWAYFDVADGDVVNLQLDTAVPPSNFWCDVIDPGFTMLVADCSSIPVDEWIQFVEGGRYYVRLYDDEATPPATYDVTTTRTHVQPAPITVGTLIDDAALPAHGYGWYELDVSGSDWLVFTAPATTDFLGDMAIDFYSRTNFGIIDYSLYSVDSIYLADPTDEAGRIVVGDDSVFLVRVMDDAFDGTGDTEVFDLLVDDRDYTDLGTITVGTDIDQADIAVTALESQYFLVHADAAGVANVDITSTGDTPVVTGLATLTYDEFDDDTAADATPLNAPVPAAGWIAFRVDETSDNAGTFDLSLTAYPPPYSWTTGTLAYTDICGTGVAHPLTDGDEGLSTAVITPQFAFDIFADAVTELTVSSNGWVTATPAYAGSAAWSNAIIPSTSAPNFFIAPFWDDSEFVEVCVLSEATKLTIQWTGVLFWTSIVTDFQLVIHDDGSFDFIYGPNHDGYDGLSATIGIENIDGTDGVQISRNTEGGSAPGTSYTLTPNF